MNAMFSAPIRPDLSLSTDPRYCDVLELDMNARTIRLRISGMQIPTLTFAEWCEDLYGDNFVYFTTAPITGSNHETRTEDPISSGIQRRLDAGERKIRMDLPRGTLWGGGLAHLHDATQHDPAWSQIELDRTFEEYLRLQGMRRDRASIERDWRIILANREAGRVLRWPEQDPALTAPGEGAFPS